MIRNPALLTAAFTAGDTIAMLGFEAVTAMEVLKPNGWVASVKRL